ncbi:MAG: glycosyltransferase family 39 protein [Chloroflexi bacterium]|nr:glycosyltransferase family 39 protein [Chloroflexota bacterium]MCL5075337.1 glycosyltransferase family 39 protein [Chloroflexota bacterium]
MGGRSAGRANYISIMILMAILVIAFGLRLWRIEAQSLWYDEGISALMAPRDLATITHDAAGDIHPPLYYYILHFWTALSGNSEIGLRYLSLIYGVLTVALTYKIGERLFNLGAGYFAGFIATFSPLLVYYSQEARMYMQVTFLAALSMYLFLRLLTRGYRIITVDSQGPSTSPLRSSLSSTGIGKVGRWDDLWVWIVYVLVTAAALYSHYFAFTIVLAQNFFLALTFWPRRSLAIKWVIAQGILLLLYVPWLAVSLKQLAVWPSVSEPFSFFTLLHKIFVAFSFGLSYEASNVEEVAFLALLVASLLLMYLPAQVGRPDRLRALAFNLAYVLFPVLVLYLLSLRRPMYNPKFLLLAVPGYCLLLGLGLDRLDRIVRCLPPISGMRLTRTALSMGAIAICVLLILTSSARSLLAYYYDPKYARDDYRGLVRQIESSFREGDAIVLNAPGQVEIFRYYYRGEGDVYPLPRQRPIDERDTEGELRRIAGGHKRVWLVLWAVQEADPNGFIEGWLDKHAYKANNTWYGGVRLCLYSLAAGEVGEATTDKVRVNFGNEVVLLGYRVVAQSPKPGDILPLTLFWQALEPLKKRYTVFVHLLDQREFICGQHDSEPAGGTKPTDSWAVADMVEDRHGIPILLGTPPGEYQIEVGLYETDTGKRLSILDEQGRATADRFLFGRVTVLRSNTPPKVEALRMPRLSGKTLLDNKVKFLGYGLYKLGSDSAEVNFAPADIAHLVLYWQALGDIEEDYARQIGLVGTNGVVTRTTEDEPMGGAYTTSKWHVGDLIRDQERIALHGLAPGEYKIVLYLKQDSGPGKMAGERVLRATVDLGSLWIR